MQEIDYIFDDPIESMSYTDGNDVRSSAAATTFPESAAAMLALVGYTPSHIWVFDQATEVVADKVGTLNFATKGSGTTLFQQALGVNDIVGVKGTEGDNSGVTGIYTNDTAGMNRTASHGSFFFLIFMQLTDAAGTRFIFGKPYAASGGNPSYYLSQSVTDGWLTLHFKTSSSYTFSHNGMVNGTNYTVLAGWDDTAATNECGICFNGDSGGYGSLNQAKADEECTTAARPSVCGLPSDSVTSTERGSDSIVAYVAVFEGAAANGMYAARNAITAAFHASVTT